MDRASGVLLHITSLPSPYGVGDLGSDAYRFIDFLAEAGQRVWQILPLGPTTRGNSPYSCYSAFAGNPVLISPQLLVRVHWLDRLPTHFDGLVLANEVLDAMPVHLVVWNEREICERGVAFTNGFGRKEVFACHLICS